MHFLHWISFVSPYFQINYVQGLGKLSSLVTFVVNLGIWASSFSTYLSFFFKESCNFEISSFIQVHLVFIDIIFSILLAWHYPSSYHYFLYFKLCLQGAFNGYLMIIQLPIFILVNIFISISYYSCPNHKICP